MSDDGSLILGNGEQLDLIRGEELDAAGLPPSAYADEEARGRFTGERLFSTNPKLYNAIAKLIARGESYRETADICAVSLNTVLGVARREAIPIESLRERMGKVGLDVARLSLEAMLELLTDPVTRAKLTLKDLAVAHGIANSNAQLALGGATARIEVTNVSAPGHADYERFLAEARAEMSRREVNVTGTGFAADAPRAKEGDPAALPAPASGLEVADLADQATAPDATK